jgi:hypothetical protein
LSGLLKRLLIVRKKTLKIPIKDKRFQTKEFIFVKILIMNKIIKHPPIKLESGSPLGEGLKKMVLHKQLREQFWLGEISLEELNLLLKEKGINKQYDHPRAV